jgi:tetratricopeptide (TPR) repeat protein
VPLFLRAIGLDPRFALAYASLGTTYHNLGEKNLSAENTKKAFDLRARVSEREKFYIESHYHHFVTGDLEKARQVYELWARTYPREEVPPNNLGTIYQSLGQYDKALGAFRETMHISADALAYINLVSVSLNLNRLKEARATVEEARAKNLDSPTMHLYLYELGFLQNDAGQMAKEVTWAMGKPGEESALQYFAGQTAAYSGQLNKSREFSRRAVESAERAGEKEMTAGVEAAAALAEALFGNKLEAQKRAVHALALSNGRDAEFIAALALAVAGDSDRAMEFADDLGKRLPDDTIVQFNYAPTVRAQLDLNRNEAARALERLQAARPYELGLASGNSNFSTSLYPVYVRGEAYLAAKQGAPAAAEFRRILEQRGVVINEPIGALAHLGLARAYALQGDKAKARAAYKDFLALWKDADPDIPILVAAKDEFAKLQ